MDKSKFTHAAYIGMLFTHNGKILRCEDTYNYTGNRNEA